MEIVTIPKKEYQILVKRQEKIEAELDMVKKILRYETDEKQIKPAVLKRWEKISRDLDKSSGRSFSSLKDMKKWLQNL